MDGAWAERTRRAPVSALSAAALLALLTGFPWRTLCARAASPPAPAVLAAVSAPMGGSSLGAKTEVRPPFPADRSIAAIEDWLRQFGGEAAGRPVLVTPNSVFLGDAASGRAGRVALRQEMLTPRAAERLGGRSAAIAFNVDCRARRATLDRAVIYPQPALRGAGRVADPDAWARADPEAEAEDILLLACGPPPSDGPLAAGSGAPAPKAGRVAGVDSPERAFVQVGAFSSEEGAAKAFAALRAALPSSTRGLSLRLEPAAGAPVRRALVGPFRRKLDADAFCAKALRRRLACLVWRETKAGEAQASWPDGTSPGRSTSPISAPTPQATPN